MAEPHNAVCVLAEAEGIGGTQSVGGSERLKPLAVPVSRAECVQPGPDSTLTIREQRNYIIVGQALRSGQIVKRLSLPARNAGTGNSQPKCPDFVLDNFGDAIAHQSVGLRKVLEMLPVPAGEARGGADPKLAAQVLMESRHTVGRKPISLLECLHAPAVPTSQTTPRAEPHRTGPVAQNCVYVVMRQPVGGRVARKTFLVPARDSASCSNEPDVAVVVFRQSADTFLHQTVSFRVMDEALAIKPR